MGDNLIVIGVIALSGVTGGYAGYLLGPPDPARLPSDQRSWYLRRSLVLGVVAAFMIPLFLSLADVASAPGQAGLIDRLTGVDSTLGTWLILVGFCLVAAVSAQRFITALTNKLLDQLLEEVDEQREELVDLAEDLQAVATPSGHQVSSAARRVLVAAYSSPERRPNLEQIAAASGLETGEIVDQLAELELRGLVKSKQVDRERQWRVRSAGKHVVALEAAGAAAPPPDQADGS